MFANREVWIGFLKSQGKDREGDGFFLVAGSLNSKVIMILWHFG